MSATSVRFNSTSGRLIVGQDVTITSTASPVVGGAAATGMRWVVDPPTGPTVTITAGDAGTEIVEAGKTWRCWFDLASAGKWRVRVESLLGPDVTGVEELTFTVDQSSV